MQVGNKKAVVDTIRIILFTECNMHCSYCCNEQVKFNTKFVTKHFREIDFSLYKNVCISGGEPFLYKDVLYEVLDKIPADKNIYIYTNGTKITSDDLLQLMKYKNLKCLNIGLHLPRQLEQITLIENFLPVRFRIQDKKKDLYMVMFPKRLHEGNIKTWHLNDCEMPNEDWVLLK